MGTAAEKMQCMLATQWLSASNLVTAAITTYNLEEVRQSNTLLLMPFLPDVVDEATARAAAEKKQR